MVDTLAGCCKHQNELLGSIKHERWGDLATQDNGGRDNSPYSDQTMGRTASDSEGWQRQGFLHSKISIQALGLTDNPVGTGGCFPVGTAVRA